MSTMTADELVMRIGTLYEGAGYSKAIEPFDFDLQPSTHLDRVYHLSAERIGSLDYVGGQQNDEYLLLGYVARRIKRDGWGAARQLKVDLDALEDLITGDYPQYPYCVIDEPAPGSDIPDPEDDQDFAVGRLRIAVTLD
jgi:hypothetical protein